MIPKRLASLSIVADNQIGIIWSLLELELGPLCLSSDATARNSLATKCGLMFILSSLGMMRANQFKIRGRSSNSNLIFVYTTAPPGVRHSVVNQTKLVDNNVIKTYLSSRFFYRVNLLSSSMQSWKDCRGKHRKAYFQVDDTIEKIFFSVVHIWLSGRWLLNMGSFVLSENGVLMLTWASRTHVLSFCSRVSHHASVITASCRVRRRKKITECNGK